MKKILVIDDDKLVLRSVERLLIRAGYEAACAASGEEAKKLVTENHFNLVICDIRMPGQNGIEVVKSLKEYFHSQNMPEVPFIFITGYASEDAPIDAIKLGVSDYILKPFDLEELLQSVAKHIQ